MSFKMQNKSIFLFLFYIVGFSSTASALPKIEGITGDLKIGATLTINGSDFSDIGNPRILYDQVDNQSAYQSLDDGSAVPLDQGIWTSGASKWGNPVEIVRTGDLRTEDANAAYFGKRKADLGWPDLFKTSTTDTLYVSWWFKPSKLVDQGGSNKFIRIWDRYDGLGTRISWTQMHMTYDALEINYTPPSDWADTQPKPGVWNHFEIYVDSKSNSITAKVNGSVRHSLNDFKKSPNSEGLTVGLIGFDPSVSTPYADYNFRMKDIYISETQARVELSNSPTWNPKSHREILNTLNWSDSSIEVELNKFAFDQLNDIYLYVVDKFGNVNEQGFPICGSCPDVLDMITVN